MFLQNSNLKVMLFDKKAQLSVGLVIGFDVGYIYVGHARLQTQQTYTQN